MPYQDLREFISAAERVGLVRRITRSVDRSWEPASLAKWMFQALPPEQRFGMIFEDVAGSEFGLATGLLGASPDAYALALEVSPADLNRKWMDALLNPREAVAVSAGVCQEVVKLGADANLSELPIPVWTPGKDAAPYITSITVNRERDTGAQNMAVYRTMVRDDHHVVINLNPGRQGHTYASSWWSAGEAAPIAWVIGTEPAVHLATVANLPIGVDEITIAGGLKGSGIELVKCQTSDLMVPANAEFIIEGEVLPDEQDDEGPFGEFAGYMGPITKKPVARITAITHRRDGLFYGYSSQMPPSESTTLQSLSNAPLLLKSLVHDHGERSVADVYIDLTFGGLLAHAIVAMTPKTPGHAKRVGRLVADMSPIKRVTVVDEYVDIRDPLDLEWALNSHYNPVRDTVIIDDVFSPMGMDPSIRIDPDHPQPGSKIVVDATATIDAGPFSLPDKVFMDRALQSWQEAGLPEFEIPKRARNRIARS